MKLSLVILTKNEIEGVRVVLPRIPRGAVDEIIAIDGGSTDGTPEYIASQGIRVESERNRGRGDAILKGVRYATGDAIIFFSPDGNEDPADIPKFRPFLEAGNDIVIASRMMRGARNEEDSQVFRFRKWVNKVFGLAANLLWNRSGKYVTDTINGFRAVRREVFTTLAITAPDYTIEYQTSIRAFKGGLKVAEFPTHEGARVGGKTGAPSIPTGLKFLRLFFTEVLMGDGAPLLFLAFICVFMFSPFLFWGGMIGGDEHVGAHYQYNLYYSEALQKGESFLWNPYSFTGFPTYINGFGTFLSPLTFIVFYLFNPLVAVGLLITLVIFGGLAFSYLVGRAFALSRQASLIVALVYGTAQLYQISLPLSTAHVFLVLPMIVFALIKAKQAKGVKSLVFYIFLGGLGVGLGFLAAYIQMYIYVLTIVGFFALFLDWQGIGNKAPFSGRAIGALSLMFALGLVIGAPQVVPLAAYAPLTSRTAEYAAEIIPQSGIYFSDAIRLFVPLSVQLPVGSSSAPFYLGVVGLFCVLVGAWFVRSRPVLFFVGLYAFLLALAASLPGFDWLNTHVPPFNRIGAIQRWLLPGTFLPALIAGFGFDHLSVIRMQPTFRRLAAFFVWVSLAGLALLVAAYGAFEIIIRSESIKEWMFNQVLSASHRTLESLQHPMSYYFAEIDRLLVYFQHAISFTNPWFLVFVSVTLLSSSALWIARRAPERTMRVVLLTAASLTLVLSYISQAGQSLISSEAYFAEVPPVVELIRSQSKSFDDNRYVLIGGELLGRVLSGSVGVPPNLTQSSLAMRDLLLHEAGTVYGLGAFNGFEAIRSKRQNLLISTVFSTRTDLVLNLEAVKAGAPIDRATNSAILRKVTAEEKAVDIVSRLPLLSMMNVTYIISLYPLKDPSLMQIAAQHIEKPSIDYFVYENRRAMPRMYFAQSPAFFEGSERDLFIALMETKDFSRKTYIECDDCAASQNSNGVVSVTHTKNGLIEATTTSMSGGWLIYSESDLPGWIATVDGVRVPIKTANYLFQAIEVPKGKHKIVFNYVGSFRLWLESFGLQKR